MSFFQAHYLAGRGNPRAISPPASLQSAITRHSPPPQSNAQRHHPYLRPEALRCRLCHFQAASPAYLKNHIRTVHLEEVHTLNCPLCEYTSDKATDIDNHLDMDHVKPLPLSASAASSAVAAAISSMQEENGDEDDVDRVAATSPAPLPHPGSNGRGSLIIID